MTGRTGQAGHPLAVQPWTPRHAAPTARNGGRSTLGHQPASSTFTGSTGTSRGRTARDKGSGLLAVASCLLLLLAAAQGYVSFRAQYAFVDHAKHAHLPSVLEALGLDTGAVIFALLGLSLARRGKAATTERVLNVVCALGSLTMNLLAANLASPRSVTVWVLPSALYGLASDRLIAVVRSWSRASDPAAGFTTDGSAWQPVGGLALWLLRLVLDLPGTVAGFRRWVLVTAPIAPCTRATAPPPLKPGKTRNGLPSLTAAPGQLDPGASQEPGATAGAAPATVALAPGETKRAALIRLYEHCGQTGDPRYGDRTRAAQLAGEIAARIGYHPGTARRELVRYLTTRPQAAPGTQPATTEAVT